MGKAKESAVSKMSLAHVLKGRKVREICMYVPVETRSVDRWKKVFFDMPLPTLPTLSLVCCRGGCDQQYSGAHVDLHTHNSPWMH